MYSIYTIYKHMYMYMQMSHTPTDPNSQLSDVCMTSAHILWLHCIRGMGKVHVHRNQQVFPPTAYSKLSVHAAVLLLYCMFTHYIYAQGGVESVHTHNKHDMYNSVHTLHESGACTVLTMFQLAVYIIAICSLQEKQRIPKSTVNVYKSVGLYSKVTNCTNVMYACNERVHCDEASWFWPVHTYM